MTLVMTVISLVVAVLGGFTGGWVVAFRMGAKWAGEIEALRARIAANEERLKRGDARVDLVPVLEARLDIMLESMGEIKQMMRDGFRTFQTKEQCEEKHRVTGRN